jgi:hypothetical protein
MINLDPLAQIVVPTPDHQDIDITVGAHSLCMSCSSRVS